MEVSCSVVRYQARPRTDGALHQRHNDPANRFVLAMSALGVGVNLSVAN
jgi:hypothetical protein